GLAKGGGAEGDWIGTQVIVAGASRVKPKSCVVGESRTPVACRRAAAGQAGEGNSALRARLAQRALDRIEHLARAERLRQKAERLGDCGAAGRLVVGEAG